MFLGSLKEQLLYPHVEHHIPDAAIEDVLQEVRLDDLLLQHGLSETRCSLVSWDVVAFFFQYPGLFGFLG